MSFVRSEGTGLRSPRHEAKRAAGGEGLEEGAELTQEHVLRAVVLLPELREQVAALLSSDATEEAKMRQVRSLLLYPPLPSPGSASSTPKKMRDAAPAGAR